MAAVSGELVRLRALRVALVEWRKAHAAFEATLVVKGHDDAPGDPQVTSDAEDRAHATLDAALRECEAP